MAKIVHYLIPNAHLRNRIYRLAVDLLIRPRVSRLNIPIVAITGTNGKSTVTKLLNRIYLEAGYRVGMCCSDFAMCNGTVLCKGDKAGASGLWRLTMQPRLDLIIAETARGGILKHGLGFRECQVGVVTNIYEDHLGQDGVYTVEKMAEVKSVVPQHTASSGTLVLNADDSLVRKMAAKTRANRVYFTMDGLPDKDLFDNLFYLRDEAIWKRINGTAERVVSVNDITITRGGMLRYNIANTMAALAVVEAMKDAFPVSHEALHASLTAFGMDPRDNIGRFSLLQYNGEALLLCSSKNPECFRRDLPIILRLKENGGFDYVVGILCAVGGRPNSYYYDISKAAAPACDAFSIHPPKGKYFRDHSADEIVELLSMAIPPDKILKGNNSTLETVFRQSRARFTGKILFVAFWALFDSCIDFEEVLDRGVSEDLASRFVGNPEP